MWYCTKANYSSFTTTYCNQPTRSSSLILLRIIFAQSNSKDLHNNPSRLYSNAMRCPNIQHLEGESDFASKGRGVRSVRFSDDVDVAEIQGYDNTWLQVSIPCGFDERHDGVLHTLQSLRFHRNKNTAPLPLMSKYLSPSFVHCAASSSIATSSAFVA
jgi:hypothetical protein